MTEDYNFGVLKSSQVRGRTISVTSGKGGVGKSNFVVNIAIELALMGHKVLVMDADFGLANLDILMNLNPEKTIEDLLAGKCTLKDILLEGPVGIHIIPASSGIPEMTDISAEDQKTLIEELATLQTDYDYFLIDTGAGISNNVLRFNASTDEVFVITNTEPTAITDAYAIMKILATKYMVKEFSLVVNCAGANAATKIFEVMQMITKKMRNPFKIIFSGYLPLDSSLISSVRSRTPHSLKNPDSTLAQHYKKIAEHLHNNPGETYHLENKKGFWDKLLRWKQTDS